MRWYDWLLGLPMWRVYLCALWQSLRHPLTDGTGKYCHDPVRCPLAHRIVILAPPGKPARVVLRHMKGQ